MADDAAAREAVVRDLDRTLFLEAGARRQVQLTAHDDARGAR